MVPVSSQMDWQKPRTIWQKGVRKMSKMMKNLKIPKYAHNHFPAFLESIRARFDVHLGQSLSFNGHSLISEGAKTKLDIIFENAVRQVFWL